MQETKAKRSLWPVRVVVLLTAVLFIVIGVMREEHLDVLQKAVKICLECVGIG